MRHRHGMRKLNRTTSHRLAMLRNMANSLLLHEAIKTTVPKAKELRRVVEPLITLAKVPTVANRRLAFNKLRDRAMVVKLFDELGPLFKERNGGYTRILKMGYRVGDNAPMAYMELVQKTTDVEDPVSPKKAKKVEVAKPVELAKSVTPAPAPETVKPEEHPEEVGNPAESIPTEETPEEEKPAQEENSAEDKPADEKPVQ